MDEVEDRLNDDDDNDDPSDKSITKASLNPIFNDEGLSVVFLAKKLKMSRQHIEYKRKKGTLEALGYTAKKKGSRWKYYEIAT
ncbi:hypothetical protein C7H19_24430 [Aphanothece hegewaldii CCALA 016]|uniref:Uncharacterized protein n=1 Tax=Aphanothece hegewaldii CCALA 016 TaxID=2107694 RepID=A0A2T1LQN3_9CHRO|nr:hypothetical protein [Aphanothece hegewaldii]PSF29173.1 hypothetical protein C7H19_24430 [Aphanothece hegewaldii CCALA 016]